MIEIRVVEHGVMCRLDFQYRYKNQLPQGCIASPDWKEWSDWETAEWIKADDYKKWIDPDETTYEEVKE